MNYRENSLPLNQSKSLFNEVKNQVEEIKKEEELKLAQRKIEEEKNLNEWMNKYSIFTLEDLISFSIKDAATTGSRHLFINGSEIFKNGRKNSLKHLLWKVNNKFNNESDFIINLIHGWFDMYVLYNHFFTKKNILRCIKSFRKEGFKVKKKWFSLDFTIYW